MPGIADSGPGGVNVGQIGNFGDMNPAPPAIGDFMAAFKSGFLTVSDLNRRVKDDVAADDERKTRLQANEIKRRLAPGDAENELAAQRLNAQKIQGATELFPGELSTAKDRQSLAGRKAQIENDLLSTDEGIRQTAQNELLEIKYQETFGHVPPESLEVPVADQAPQDYETWVQATGAPQIQAELTALSGPPTPERMAENQKLEEGLRTEYRQYAEGLKNQTQTIPRGSPEYYNKLRENLAIRGTQQQLQAGKLGAVVKGFEEEVKAGVKSAFPDPAVQSKAQDDNLKLVLDEKRQSAVMKRFEPQAAAFAAVDQLKSESSGRTPTNTDDVALLYSLIKALDPTSVVREGELKITQSAVPSVQRLYGLAKGVISDKNKLFDDGTRNNIYQTLESLKQSAISVAKPELKRLSGLAIDRGVPLNQVFTESEQKFLFGESTNTSSGGAASPPSAGAKRVVQNGVTFEWNGSQYVPVP